MTREDVSGPRTPSFPSFFFNRKKLIQRGIPPFPLARARHHHPPPPPQTRCSHVSAAYPYINMSSSLVETEPIIIVGGVLLLFFSSARTSTAPLHALLLDVTNCVGVEKFWQRKRCVRIRSKEGSGDGTLSLSLPLLRKRREVSRGDGLEKQPVDMTSRGERKEGCLAVCTRGIREGGGPLVAGEKGGGREGGSGVDAGRGGLVNRSRSARR